jgi:hypothetical protein
MPQVRKSSPSRWRFCPLSPLTFRFRVQPSGGASTYSRSVLGASRNLCTRRGTVKTVRQGITALCDVSPTESDERPVCARSACGSHACSSSATNHVRYRTGGPMRGLRKAVIRSSLHTATKAAATRTPTPAATGAYCGRLGPMTPSGQGARRAELEGRTAVFVAVAFRSAPLLRRDYRCNRS